MVGSSSFMPYVTLGLSNLYSGHYSDIIYSLSQQTGESYLSNGTLTSSAGYFDIDNLDVGDVVGFGNIEFLDGTDFGQDKRGANHSLRGRDGGVTDRVASRVDSI